MPTWDRKYVLFGAQLGAERTLYLSPIVQLEETVTVCAQRGAEKTVTFGAQRDGWRSYRRSTVHWGIVCRLSRIVEEK